MRLIERYLFRQLLWPTLLATAALGGVALLSQSLSALDIIVDQRQSALVFVQVTLLALPMLINMILPIAVFVAALVALNRLQTEQELVVASAGGLSRWKLSSPGVRLALIATLIGLVINLWVQPLSYRTMRQVLFEARTDIAATLVREGEFTEPVSGLTIYGQTVERDGLIRNLFIHQQMPGGGAATYTAKEGRVARRDGAPVLVMQQGSTQQFSRRGVLNFLTFEEYAFDLGPMMQGSENIRYKASDRYLHELFFPDLSQEEDRKNRLRYLAEGHSRLASPLYNITFMAMALGAVVGAGFSRLGYGRRIAMVAGLAALVRILGFAVQAAADDMALINIGQYLIPIAGAWWGFGQVFRKPVSRNRRRPVTAGAPA
ncbi:MAG TPA: LPS export ABC transporter permease LptF [Caulobacteraceae bacterium]|nr:LPS export ABC transporter permease LptF [Caulobacteraceae bacterium]